MCRPSHYLAILLLGIIALPGLARPTTNCPTPSPYPAPPLRGVVTFMEPHGQFYINIGKTAQLYKGATLKIFHENCEIASAWVIHVNRLDAIAQLPKEQIGLQLAAGDIVEVDYNPIPQILPSGLPKVEPDPSQHDYDIVYGLLFFYGIGSIIAHEL